MPMGTPVFAASFRIWDIDDHADQRGPDGRLALRSLALQAASNVQRSFRRLEGYRRILTTEVTLTAFPNFPPAIEIIYDFA